MLLKLTTRVLVCNCDSKSKFELRLKRGVNLPRRGLKSRRCAGLRVFYSHSKPLATYNQSKA